MTRKKLVTLLGSVCLILVLAALPFMTACPAPVEEECVTDADCPEGYICVNGVCVLEEEEEPIEVITLKFNDWGPPGIGIGELHQQAADMIEERTDGRVVVDCYFSQSLLKYPDTFVGVSEGIADIALYVVGATPGVHALNEVFGLPFVGDIPGMMAGAEIYRDLLAQFPEFEEENAAMNVKWLSIRVMPPNQLHLVDKPITVPEDIRGMTIITGTGPIADMLNAQGASAVQLGPPDWYTSLERGLAEAQITHWAAVHDFQLTELFSYHTHFGGGGAGMVPIGFLVNLDTWNKLSAHDQQVLVDVYDWVNEESLIYDIELIETAVIEAIDVGHIVTELTPEQIALWAAAAEPYVEEWIVETEAEGWPAREVYESLKQLIAEHQ